MLTVVLLSVCKSGGVLSPLTAIRGPATNIPLEVLHNQALQVDFLMLMIFSKVQISFQVNLL